MWKPFSLCSETIHGYRNAGTTSPPPTIFPATSPEYGNVGRMCGGKFCVMATFAGVLAGVLTLVTLLPGAQTGKVSSVASHSLQSLQSPTAQSTAQSEPVQMSTSKSTISPAPYSPFESWIITPSRLRE